MDILIRTLTREDLHSHADEFVEILKSEPHEYWSKENFLAELPGKYQFSVLALSKETLAGYIIASLKDKGPYIHKFMVRDSFRSRSVGKMMLEYFERTAVEQNHWSVSLAVLEENTGAQRFYEKNGFSSEGSRTDSKTGATLLLMTKLLRR
jgi:ribosomal protein S18 acetylase RimI-like enzyme